MPVSLERSRGDRWAAHIRAHGWWAQKLPASAMAGLPDWLVGREGEHSTRWVEAKTLEAVLDSRGVPKEACSAAQRFFLDRVWRAGDWATVLVLGEDRYLELTWECAEVPLTAHLFHAVGFRYDGG